MSDKFNRASMHAGMGAIPGAKGVTFRVWAPHAEKVYAIGTFNDWSKTTTPLIGEPNGYWSADVPGAKVGDEYRYLINTSVGWKLPPFSRTDPYARKVTSSVGSSINAIEVMPVMEFAGDFSLGYDPSHPFAIKSIYGGPDAFKKFVKAAHAHGIAVIVDVIYNHFGPSDLDLWQFDGWSENNKGGIYFYNDHRSNTPWGETRPDYGRSEVRQYLRDNALMWFEECHVDDLRWDMIVYMNSIDDNGGDSSNAIPDGWRLMQEINVEIQQRFPGKISIAEGMHRNDMVTRDVVAGGCGFNAQWDADFVHLVREAVIVGDDESRDLGAVSRAIEHRYDLDSFKRIIYTESHDAVSNGRARLPEDIWPGKADSWFSRKRSTLAGALVLTSPGIPMIFEGQELLEDHWLQDKVPIDWSRAKSQHGIHDMYRELIALRRNLSDGKQRSGETRGPGVTRGLGGQNIHLYHFNNAAKMIAFHRWDKQGPHDSVVVVVNMMNQIRDDYAIGFPRAGLWKVRFNSDSSNYGEDFANHPSPDVEALEESVDGLPCSGKINIGPYTVVIYSQDK